MPPKLVFLEFVSVAMEIHIKWTHLIFDFLLQLLTLVWLHPDVQEKEVRDQILQLYTGSLLSGNYLPFFG
jgi:hypothetical protein